MAGHLLVLLAGPEGCIPVCCASDPAKTEHADCPRCLHT